jgi:hypothetical protein
LLTTATVNKNVWVNELYAFPCHPIAIYHKLCNYLFSIFAADYQSCLPTPYSRFQSINHSLEFVLHSSEITNVEVMQARACFQYYLNTFIVFAQCHITQTQAGDGVG